MTEPQTIEGNALAIVANIERIRAERGPDLEPAPGPSQYDRDRNLWDSVILDIRSRMSRHIPARYDDAIPSDPAVELWVDQALSGRGEGLLILGPVGTGKTWQAYGALRQIIAADAVPTITAGTAADLLEGCRPGRATKANPTWRNNYDESEPDPVGDLQRVNVLLIDDIGAFKASEWTAETLYRIIDARWANCRPTIVTSNLTPTALTEALGDRLASRLAGCCQRVALKGKDRRRAS